MPRLFCVPAQPCGSCSLVHLQRVAEGVDSLAEVQGGFLPFTPPGQIAQRDAEIVLRRRPALWQLLARPHLERVEAPLLRSG
jgi:hypothetical protein